MRNNRVVVRTSNGRIFVYWLLIGCTTGGPKLQRSRSTRCVEVDRQVAVRKSRIRDWKRCLRILCFLQLLMIAAMRLTHKLSTGCRPSLLLHFVRWTPSWGGNAMSAADVISRKMHSISCMEISFTVHLLFMSVSIARIRKTMTFISKFRYIRSQGHWHNKKCQIFPCNCNAFFTHKYSEIKSYYDIGDHIDGFGRSACEGSAKSKQFALPSFGVFSKRIIAFPFLLPIIRKIRSILAILIHLAMSFVRYSIL